MRGVFEASNQWQAPLFGQRQQGWKAAFFELLDAGKKGKFTLTDGVHCIKAYFLLYIHISPCATGLIELRLADKVQWDDPLHVEIVQKRNSVKGNNFRFPLFSPMFE